MLNSAFTAAAATAAERNTLFAQRVKGF